MVNGFSRSYAPSIAVSTAQTNQKQAGPQMAGLPPTETSSVARARGYAVRGYSKTQAFMSVPIVNRTPTRNTGAMVYSGRLNDGP
mgnify:FL=1